MKLNKETLVVLKNFADLNNGIELREGNTLRTVHEHEVMIAEATLPQEFPQDFAIYDLRTFLNINNALNDPDYNFDGDVVEIKDGRRFVKYRQGDRDTIALPRNYKPINLPEVITEFTIPWSDLDSLLKMTNYMNTDTAAIIGKDNTVTMQALNVKAKDPSSNNRFIIEIDAEFDNEFSCYFKTEYLKFIPGEYTISVTHKAGQFFNNDFPVKYWVSPESISKF